MLFRYLDIQISSIAIPNLSSLDLEYSILFMKSFEFNSTRQKEGKSTNQKCTDNIYFYNNTTYNCF